MKQFKTISMFAFLLLVFSISEMAAQQNWRLSLTTDYHISFDHGSMDYWKGVFGDEYSSLKSRKTQKSSVILNADYHFFTQKPVGFFIGTGIGHRTYEVATRTRASFESVHIIPLHNVAVPWRIGLDLRPTDRLTINLSATYEHMFPAAGGGGVGTSLRGEELSSSEYIFGEIPEHVSSIGYTVWNQGGGTASIDIGFDIEIYKNYRLFVGTGIGASGNAYETSHSVREFSNTGEPDASSSYFSHTYETNKYSFVSLKTGITKTF